MTDNKTKLDIAQRIAEALARTTEPTMSADGDFNPDEDTVIGEVPEHLRHLHNLLCELENEARAAKQRLLEATNRHDTLHDIFFDALEQHVPSDGDSYNGVKLCPGWQVIGYKSSRSGDMMDDLRELVAKAVMGGSR